jgi:predicted transcriptional regulator
VSLRGQKDDESAKPTVSFRCPPELRRYIEETAAAYRRDKTEVITDAIALDRDLATKLKPDAAKLEAFATSQSLKMDDDLAEVLARLVRQGLAATGRSRGAK